MSEPIEIHPAEELERDRDQERFQAEEEALGRVLGEIDRLDLRDNLIELETIGYTTLRGVLPEDQVMRAKASILDYIEERGGKKIDPETATAEDFGGLTFTFYMLYRDPVFQEILLQPKPLALITYLLGESCVLSSLGCHFKGPGEDGTIELHSDNAFVPMPYPLYSMVANTNYALTPYNKELGALAMVPRSHLLGREPTTRENKLSGDEPNPNALAMELNPGDAVVWGSNAWHGSFPRKVPGIRMNLSCYFARQFVAPQELYAGDAPEEVMKRYADNERFKVLIGEKQCWGWKREGPDYEKMAKSPKGRFD